MYVFFLKFACPNITGSGIVRNFSSSSLADQGVAVGFDQYSGALKAYLRSYDAVPVTPSSAARVGDAGIAFDASSSNAIYKNSTTVQPSSLVFNYIIKY